MLGSDQSLKEESASADHHSNHGDTVIYQPRPIDKIDEQFQGASTSPGTFASPADSLANNITAESLAILEAMFVSTMPVDEFISLDRSAPTLKDFSPDPSVATIADAVTKRAVSRIKTYRHNNTRHEFAGRSASSGSHVSRFLHSYRIRGRPNTSKTLNSKSFLAKKDHHLGYSQFVDTLTATMNVPSYTGTEIFHSLCKGSPETKHFLYNDIIACFTDPHSHLRQNFPMEAACAIYTHCHVEWLDFLNFLNAKTDSAMNPVANMRFIQVKTPITFAHRLAIDTCVYVPGLEVYLSSSRDGICQIWMPPHLNSMSVSLRHLRKLLKEDCGYEKTFGFDKEFFETLLKDLTVAETHSGLSSTCPSFDPHDPLTETTKRGTKGETTDSINCLTELSGKHAGRIDNRNSRFAVETILNILKFMDRMTLFDLHADNINEILEASGSSTSDSGNTASGSKMDFALIHSITDPDTDATVLPIRDDCTTPRIISEDREGRPECYKDTFSYRLLAAVRNLDSELVSMRPKGERIYRSLKPEVMTMYDPQFVKDLKRRDTEEEEHDRELQHRIVTARGKFFARNVIIGRSELTTKIRMEASNATATCASLNKPQTSYNDNSDGRGFSTSSAYGKCSESRGGSRSTGSRCSAPSRSFLSKPPASRRFTRGFMQYNIFANETGDQRIGIAEHPLMTLKSIYAQDGSGVQTRYAESSVVNALLRIPITELARRVRESKEPPDTLPTSSVYKRLERYAVMADIEKSARSVINNKENAIMNTSSSWVSSAVYSAKTKTLILACALGCLRLYRVTKGFELFKKVVVCNIGLAGVTKVDRVLSRLHVGALSELSVLSNNKLPYPIRDFLVKKFGLDRIRNSLELGEADRCIYTCDGYATYCDYLFDQRLHECSFNPFSPCTNKYATKSDEGAIAVLPVRAVDYRLNIHIPGYFCSSICPQNGGKPVTSEIYVCHTSTSLIFLLGESDASIRDNDDVATVNAEPDLHEQVNPSAINPDAPNLYPTKIRYKTLMNYTSGGPNARRMFHAVDASNFYILYNLELLFQYLKLKLGLINAFLNGKMSADQLLHSIKQDFSTAEQHKHGATNEDTGLEGLEGYMQEDYRRHRGDGAANFTINNLISSTVKNDSEFLNPCATSTSSTFHGYSHCTRGNVPNFIQHTADTSLVSEYNDTAMKQDGDSTDTFTTGVPSDSGEKPVSSLAEIMNAAMYNVIRSIQKTTEFKSLYAHPGWVTCNYCWYSTHSNKDILVTGMSTGDVLIWNLVTLRPQYFIHAFQDSEVTNIAFDPDNNVLYCACITGACRIFNYEISLDPIAELKEASSVQNIFYSPASDIIITVLINGDISMWSNRLFNQIHRISTGVEPTASLWDEANSILIICSREMYVYKLSGGEIIQETRKYERCQELREKAKRREQLMKQYESASISDALKGKEILDHSVQLNQEKAKMLSDVVQFGNPRAPSAPLVLTKSSTSIIQGPKSTSTHAEDKLSYLVSDPAVTVNSSISGARYLCDNRLSLFRMRNTSINLSFLVPRGERPNNPLSTGGHRFVPKNGVDRPTIVDTLAKHKELSSETNQSFSLRTHCCCIIGIIDIGIENSSEQIFNGPILDLSSSAPDTTVIIKKTKIIDVTNIITVEDHVDSATDAPAPLEPTDAVIQKLSGESDVEKRDPMSRRSEHSRVSIDTMRPPSSCSASTFANVPDAPCVEINPGTYDFDQAKMFLRYHTRNTLPTRSPSTSPVRLIPEFSQERRALSAMSFPTVAVRSTSLTGTTTDFLPLDARLLSADKTSGRAVSARARPYRNPSLRKSYNLARGRSLAEVRSECFTDMQKRGQQSRKRFIMAIRDSPLMRNIDLNGYVVRANMASGKLGEQDEGPIPSVSDSPLKSFDPSNSVVTSEHVSSHPSYPHGNSDLGPSVLLSRHESPSTLSPHFENCVDELSVCIDISTTGDSTDAAAMVVTSTERRSRSLPLSISSRLCAASAVRSASTPAILGHSHSKTDKRRAGPSSLRKDISSSIDHFTRSQSLTPSASRHISTLTSTQNFRRASSALSRRPNGTITPQLHNSTYRDGNSSKVFNILKSQARTRYARAQSAFNVQKSTHIPGNGIDIMSSLASKIQSEIRYFPDILDNYDTGSVIPTASVTNRAHIGDTLMLRREFSLDPEDDIDDFILRNQLYRTSHYKTRFLTLDKEGNVCLWAAVQVMESIEEIITTEPVEDNSAERINPTNPYPSALLDSPSSSIALTPVILSATVQPLSPMIDLDNHPKKTVPVRLPQINRISESQELDIPESSAHPSSTAGTTTVISQIRQTVTRTASVQERIVFITSFNIPLPEEAYISTVSYDAGIRSLIIGLTNGVGLLYNLDLNEVTSSYHVSNCAISHLKFQVAASEAAAQKASDEHKHAFDAANRFRRKRALSQVMLKQPDFNDSHELAPLHDCNNHSNPTQVSQVLAQHNILQHMHAFDSILACGHFVTRFMTANIHDALFCCGNMLFCFGVTDSTKLSEKFVGQMLKENAIDIASEGLTNPPRAILTGHSGSLKFIDTAASCSIIVTADTDGRILFWSGIGIIMAKTRLPDESVIQIRLAEQRFFPGLCIAVTEEGGVWAISPSWQSRLFSLQLSDDSLRNAKVCIATQRVSVMEASDGALSTQLLLCITINNICTVFRLLLEKKIPIRPPDSSALPVHIPESVTLSDTIHTNDANPAKTLNSITSDNNVDRLVFHPVTCYGQQCSCCNIESVFLPTNNLGILIGGSSGHSYFLPIRQDLKAFDTFITSDKKRCAFTVKRSDELDHDVITHLNESRVLLTSTSLHKAVGLPPNIFTSRLFARLEEVDKKVANIFTYESDDNVADLVKPLLRNKFKVSDRIVRADLLRAYNIELAV